MRQSEPDERTQPPGREALQPEDERLLLKPPAHPIASQCTVCVPDTATARDCVALILNVVSP